MPILVWRFATPVLGVSSAPLGGGIGMRHWVVNATVSTSYARMDPHAHLAEIAAGAGLTGDGVGMLTAVDVTSRVSGRDGGVLAVATVGLGHPTWAAAPDGDLRRMHPGTVNIVAFVPATFSESALVNAVMTATEAKTQALWEHGVDATGTASDAVFVACHPSGVIEPYGGPRSAWGARLARAVHAAVGEGVRAWLSGRRPSPP